VCVCRSPPMQASVGSAALHGCRSVISQRERRHVRSGSHTRPPQRSQRKEAPHKTRLLDPKSKAPHAVDRCVINKHKHLFIYLLIYLLCQLATRGERKKKSCYYCTRRYVIQELLHTFQRHLRSSQRQEYTSK